MIKNYFIVAWRGLLRQRGITIINLFGLTLAVTIGIFVTLYLRQELTFDRFHTKIDRMFRVIEERNTPARFGQQVGVTAAPVAPYLAEQNGVESATRLFRLGRFSVRHGVNWFYESDYLFAEPSFFDVFDFPVRLGQAAAALNEPHSVILTTRAVEKYFGAEDPIGKTLEVERLGPMKVTAVLEELPANSHLHFSMLFSQATLNKENAFRQWFENWQSDDVITYAVLSQGMDPAAFRNKISRLLVERRKDSGSERLLDLQPVGDVHLYSGHINLDRNHLKGSPRYLYVFGFLALAILAVAGINYVNLTTVRSLRRIREVGIRKTVGARWEQLILQFLAEGFLLVGAAFVLSIGIVESLLPKVNDVTSLHLEFAPVTDPVLMIYCFAFVILMGFLSGLYPAWLMSRLGVAHILRSGSAAPGRAKYVRSSLVVAQFTVSVVMILVTAAAYVQMEFVNQTSLGFDRDHVLIIDINTSGVRRNLAAVKNDFGTHSSVRSISVSSRVPGEWKDLPTIEAREAGENSPSTALVFYAVDEDFLSTYGIQLVEGRNFSAQWGTDTLAILINESARSALGWRDAVGRTLDVPESHFKATVVGVVRDFHFRSLHDQVEPMMLGFLSPQGLHPLQNSDYFSIRYQTEDLPAMLGYMRQVGERHDPEHPFEFNFLDERIFALYSSDRRIGALFAGAALLAVLIACLGLFSLATLAAAHRRREMSIRKVFGAGVSALTAGLAMEFLRLVVAANVLGWPIAYVCINMWLDDYAYKMPLSAAWYMMAGCATLIIAGITVVWQSFRVASTNPVHVLRYE